MTLELEDHEVEYIDDLLHDKYHIYSNRNPIIQIIRDKIEESREIRWNQYVMSKVIW